LTQTAQEQEYVDSILQKKKAQDEVTDKKAAKRRKKKENAMKKKDAPAIIGKGVEKKKLAQ
jgi:hypothetical protein